MSNIGSVIMFLLSCVLAENIVLARLMGVSTALREAGSVKTACALGLLTALVTTVSAALSWMATTWCLTPLKAEFLQYIVCILIILGVTALCLKLLGEKLAGVENALGSVACNCAVLGAAILSLREGLSLGMTILSAFGGGIGFLLALVLMAGVQERLSTSKIPESMKGFPISLISASLMALAFMGFAGIG